MSHIISMVLSGGSSNSDPDRSLGGDSSPYPVADSANNVFDAALFNAIDNDNSEVTDYRCVYLFNESETISLTDVKVWMEADTTVCDVEIGVGDPGDIASNIGYENNPPSDVDFFQPLSEDEAIIVGGLSPLEGFYVWIKRTIPEEIDDSIETDGFVLRMSGKQ